MRGWRVVCGCGGNTHHSNQRNTHHSNQSRGRGLGAQRLRCSALRKRWVVSARPPELWSSLGTLLSKRAGLGRAGCVLGKQSLVIKHAKSGFQLIKRLCLIV